MIEPSKTDLGPQVWTGNYFKWQLASLEGELRHLRLPNRQTIILVRTHEIITYTYV